MAGLYLRDLRAGAEMETIFCWLFGGLFFVRSICSRASNSFMSLSANSDSRCGSDSFVINSQRLRHCSFFVFFFVVMKVIEGTQLAKSEEA
jgi:hypothetical protein